MVWLANPERSADAVPLLRKKGLRLPALSLGYGTISVTLTRWNHSVRSCVKRLIWALRTLI